MIYLSNFKLLNEDLTYEEDEDILDFDKDQDNEIKNTNTSKKVGLLLTSDEEVGGFCCQQRKQALLYPIGFWGSFRRQAAARDAVIQEDRRRIQAGADPECTSSAMARW